VAKRLAAYRVDPGLHDAVTAKAAREGVTVTEVIVRAFREYVSGEYWVHEASGIAVRSDPAVEPGGAEVRSGASAVRLVNLGGDEPAAGPCRHPSEGIDELGKCGDCGEDVW
jgi:hypothetical protein